MEIARTPAALFRQMRAQGRPLAELELVRRAYDFGVPFHSARYEVDGTPFATHGIGVASAMSQIGAPAEAVAAGVLHNVYSTGDWGDGRGAGPHPARRRRLVAEVAPEVERLLTALYDARTRRHMVLALADDAELTDEQRWLLALDLTDFLDKWEDGRIRYSLPGRGDRRFVEGNEAAVVDLARRVGGSEFADALGSAFDRSAAEEIPASLMIGRTYSEVVPPPSLARRRSVELRRRARMVAGGLRRTVREALGHRADRTS